MVVIPTNGFGKRRVAPTKASLLAVQAILSNRVVGQEEHYLVQWKSEQQSNTPPLSWHAIEELVRCLEEVQDYLEARSDDGDMVASKKRKALDDPNSTRRASPFERRLHQNDRTSSASPSPSVASVPSLPEAYNGVLDADEHGYMFCRPSSGPDIARLDITNLPMDMKRAAQSARVTTALSYIRAEYIRRLKNLPGPSITLYNIVDSTTPSLRFKYIPDYVLREGVYRAPADAQVGCQSCKPNDGRNIGCEYTQRCDCLEYAAVNEANVTSAADLATYAAWKQHGGSTMGLPKKFPYWTGTTKVQRAGCLVPFYLHSRNPIFECNSKCHCGPTCRNKNVQFGRTVPLEIFKTDSLRGWGLRCLVDLHQGQFIDTYRGEILTDAEASRREAEAESNASSSAKASAKASYLYSLDKFAETENLAPEDVYVVDGEFMGGPSKFINHSCEPNARQYTVSYNKHDCRVYDIAFFACRFIPRGEEITFDYLDKDDGADEADADDEPDTDAHDDDDDTEDADDADGEGKVRCLCGADKCRKWLWT
ncbi:hypothetical protein ACEQ8H_005359 [Pleosporales sp. CAS-2024a]